MPYVYTMLITDIFLSCEHQAVFLPIMYMIWLVCSFDSMPTRERHVVRNDSYLRQARLATLWPAYIRQHLPGLSRRHRRKKNRLTSYTADQVHRVRARGRHSNPPKRPAHRVSTNADLTYCDHLIQSRTYFRDNSDWRARDDRTRWSFVSRGRFCIDGSNGQTGPRERWHVVRLQPVHVVSGGWRSGVEVRSQTDPTLDTCTHAHKRTHGHINT